MVMRCNGQNFGNRSSVIPTQRLINKTIWLLVSWNWTEFDESKLLQYALQSLTWTIGTMILIDRRRFVEPTVESGLLLSNKSPPPRPHVTCPNPFHFPLALFVRKQYLHWFSVSSPSIWRINTPYCCKVCGGKICRRKCATLWLTEGKMSSISSWVCYFNILISKPMNSNWTSMCLMF